MICLSIIIPHYNSSESLVKLLESIPNRKEIQILVIDDHSNEEEKQKLLKIEEANTHENIQFLSNKPDKKGAGACRNIGLEKAEGEWVLFADSDDFFLDGFYDIVKNHFHTDFDVVFFKPTSMESDTGNISNRHTAFVKLLDDYSNAKSRKSGVLLRYRFVVPWSKLIRRKVIVENGIMFDEVISSNDVMFSTKVGYHMKSFNISNDTIYCVTKNKGSLTVTINDKVFDTRLGVFIRYYHFLKDHLNKEDFGYLDLSGQGYILNSRKYGLKKLYKVLKTLTENKVRPINQKMLNPLWFYKRASFMYSYHKKEKRFYEKN